MWAGWRLGPDAGLQGAGGRGQGARWLSRPHTRPSLVTWVSSFLLKRLQIYFEMGAEKRVFVSKNYNICWEPLSLSFFEMCQQQPGLADAPLWHRSLFPQGLSTQPCPEPQHPTAHPEVQRASEGSLGVDSGALSVHSTPWSVHR